MTPKIRKIFTFVIAGIALVFLARFLGSVFLGRIILPQAFSLGPLTIHYYGIIMAAAAASGFYLAIKRASKYKIGEKSAEDLIFWIIVSGFLGARIYHVFSSFDYYLASPADIIKIWNGGLAIHGAVIGGIVALLIYSKISNIKYQISNTLDWLTPSLLLGQIIGRFGNLFNYEAFGYPTNLPWKMFVPAEFVPEQYGQFSFYHPWFLYEALGNALILFLLAKIIKPKRPGAIFFYYLLLYNVLRFGLEFLRIDSTFVGNFRLSAIVSLSLIFLASFWLKFTGYVKKS